MYLSFFLVMEEGLKPTCFIARDGRLKASSLNNYGTLISGSMHIGHMVIGNISKLVPSGFSSLIPIGP